MIPLLCLVRPVSPKEVYDGGAQLSRLVSTVCVCEEGGVAIYVCVSVLRILQLFHGCVFSFFTHYRCPVGNVCVRQVAH